MWLWGRYDVPQNVFLVLIKNENSFTASESFYIQSQKQTKMVTISGEKDDPCSLMTYTAQLSRHYVYIFSLAYDFYRAACNADAV